MMKPQSLVIRMQCGCEVDEHSGCLIHPCAGHRSKVIPMQVARRTTPTPGLPASSTSRTDHSAQMLGWVLLLLVCLLWGSVGAWVGYRHGFERGVRDHVAAFEEQTR